MILPQLIHYLFLVYTLMILARILSSWIPELQRLSIMYYVFQWTEPYLGFFRRILPPLGMFDISPIVALFALHFLEQFLIMLVI